VDRIARAVPLILGGAAVILGLSWLIRAPDFVDRVTIANQTAFDVDVNVAAAGGGVLDLTYIPAGDTKAVRGVIDQGNVWVFRFSYGGTDAGTLRLERTKLERDDWKVEVPEEVAERLRRAGHERLAP
jgi:hypothetical protein